MNVKTLQTLCVLGAAGLMTLLPGTAWAQCGASLTANTTLTGNLSCAGNGPELVASNITLDCAGFTISGSGSGIGILLNNVSQVSVVNCTVESFNTGIRIDGGDTNKLSGNFSVSNTGRGFSVSSSHKNALVQNKAADNGSNGFDIGNGSTNNQLENNTSFLNIGRGFQVYNSDDNALIQNRARSNGFRGFDIINSDSNHIEANIAVGNWSAGMIVQDYLGGTSSGNRLYDNQIQGSGSEGLAMFASGNLVQGLVSDSNGTWGIRDTSGAANTYIGNSCSGNPSGASSPAGLC